MRIEDTTLKTFALLFISVVLCTPLVLAADDDLPAGGKPWTKPDMLAVESLSTRVGTDGLRSIQDSGDQRIGQTLRIKLVSRPVNTWDTAINVSSSEPVKKGDAILIGFWARGQATEGTGGGVAEIVFERNGPPHTKSVQYLVETPADGSWKHYWVRCHSAEDYGADGSIVAFQTGYLRQEFEIGNVQVRNYGDRPLNELPSTPLTYVGRELDATWRVEADRRIEKHRKGDLQIKVVDAAGQNVSGASVKVHLDRHAFAFGTAASVPMITGEGPDNDRYRQMISKLFNVATIENGLKWRTWHNQDSQADTLAALQWLNQNRVTPRGHVMVWPGHRYLPTWIKPIESNPESLNRVIDGHIRELGYATDSLVGDWDVLNEVFDNRDLTNVLGDEAMTRWFNVARGVAPKSDLYYNDYAGLVRGGHPTVHKNHFEKTIQYLVDNKAPIDGIGIQGHFGALLTPPERMLEELDRWAKFNLKIMITEFDVTVPGDDLRADFTRDFLITCFSHPKVNGIVTWGFWEGAHWRPEAALYDKDWKPTKMGAHWEHLITKQWMTDETVQTDSTGNATVRGFLGSYSVTVDGKTTSNVQLDKAGSSITIRLGS